MIRLEILFLYIMVFLLENPSMAKGHEPAGNHKIRIEDIVIEKAFYMKGFMNLLVENGSHYIELTDSIIGRDILVFSRFINLDIKAPRVFLSSNPGGKPLENLIRFEIFDDKKIRLIAADKVCLLNYSVQRINSRNAYMLEADSLLSRDDILFLSAEFKKVLKLGNSDANKYLVTQTRAYANDFEITSKRFWGANSIELNTTFILLSKVAMMPRYLEPAVGYFYKIDSVHADRNNIPLKMITKWRLEPRPEDMDDYRNGKKVLPQKPIVFYLDTTIPSKWIPFFKKGVEDWLEAFEHAGFKNAIIAKNVPAKSEDSTFNMYDGYYSVIHFFDSDIEDGTFSTVIDPRSGEILQSHILISNAIFRLMRNGYLIQASPSDARARKLTFDDQLMGELLRAHISHEVGHALGLPHNMAASWYSPTEKLRDSKWLEANGGHTVSIMDYARYNYVAQPQDNIREPGIIRHIGAYDRWAIEWGYKVFPGTLSHEEEGIVLRQWILKKDEDRKYWFNDGSSNDPRTAIEALGNDPIASSEYGILNLKYVLSHLIEWTNAKEKESDTLKELYADLITQFNIYVGHVDAYIGGTYDTTSFGKKGQFRYVSKSMQKQAVRFIIGQIAKAPDWLIDTAVIRKTNTADSVVIERLQRRTLGNLLSAQKLGALFDAKTGKSVYPIKELLHDIEDSVWSDLKNQRGIDKFRMSLQNVYIDIVFRVIESNKNNRVRDEIKTMFRQDLTLLGKTISKKIPIIKDQITLQHLTKILMRLNKLKIEG